jgi:predicted O-methyltransferase YrrM
VEIKFSMLNIEKEARVKWKRDENVMFLDPLDAFLSMRLIKNPEGNLCEIGVYKGGFIMALLENLPNLNAIAIDPYPNSEEIRNVFVKNLGERNLANRVQLFDDYENLAQREFDLIHIDGEHTESAVRKDLKFALANLSSNGIVVIDDIRHPLFPGIISATLKVVHQDLLAPFLITRDKMFLCNPSKYISQFHQAKELLDQLKIPYSAGVTEGTILHGESAIISLSNSINGYDQLVVENLTKFEQLILLGLENPVRSNKLKSILKSLTPPIIISVYRNLKARPR